MELIYINAVNCLVTDAIQKHDQVSHSNLPVKIKAPICKDAALYYI